MKKLICFILFSVATILAVQAKKYDSFHNSKADPYATFDSIWVDYDIKENDVLGMRIHVKFSAYGMRDMDAYLAIYYTYNDDISGVLKDKNQKFVSSVGDVAVYRSIKPAYDPAIYDDLSVFMPYNELDLEPGIYDLTMDVKIIYKAGGEISQLTYYDFEYSKPGSPADVESNSKVDVVFDEMWIEYDITEAGKKGMRIHLKFSAKNMKGIDAYAAIYFEKKNGEKIDGLNSAYRSKNGQLAVYKSIKPAYDDAVYKDLQLFMPYEEINVGKGKFDLKLVADIILTNGDLVKHLEDRIFWFER
ncbi:MAG: hypothetical protein HZB42_06825 [Sphingobacteriales bacterium]|nr:hypothetical protein [Sphingobacteriales bacterium]